MVFNDTYKAVTVCTGCKTLPLSLKEQLECVRYENRINMFVIKIK
jgi:hypothetical protein